jgi:hypothetical protein
LSWTSRTSFRALTALALCTAGAAQAGSIVVRSAGTKAYPAGKVLADNARIILKSGESVTILDGKGTRVLNGPGTFSTVVGGGVAQETRVRSILGNSGTRTARTGAIRGTEVKSRPPSIWQADISTNGTICVATPDKFSAWRPTSTAAASYTVTRISDGKSAPLNFNVAQTYTLWPVAALPVTDRSSFRITGGGLAAPVTIQFVLMGTAPTGLESTVSEMMSRGCTGQYELLIDMVSVMEPALPAS